MESTQSLLVIFFAFADGRKDELKRFSLMTTPFRKPAPNTARMNGRKKNKIMKSLKLSLSHQAMTRFSSNNSSIASLVRYAEKKSVPVAARKSNNPLSKGRNRKFPGVK